MGMFDSIYADIKCPTTGEVVENEIQIKWYYWLSCKSLKVGDNITEFATLARLEESKEYKNGWHREDYVCESCSGKKTNKEGTQYVDSSKMMWHNCYIKMKDWKIVEVISEEEAKERKLKEFIVSWRHEQGIYTKKEKEAMAKERRAINRRIAREKKKYKERTGKDLTTEQYIAMQFAKPISHNLGYKGMVRDFVKVEPIEEAEAKASAFSLIGKVVEDKFKKKEEK